MENESPITDDLSVYLADLVKTNPMIHTVRVYNNDSIKQNTVLAEHLESHVKYNLTMRPGCAFFVQGKCVGLGYLSMERCTAWETKIATLTPPKHKLPYL